MKIKKLKVLSLFSGAGGLDLGFKKSGHEIVWANDFDKDSCETYKKNIGYHYSKLLLKKQFTKRFINSGLLSTFQFNIIKSKNFDVIYSPFLFNLNFLFKVIFLRNSNCLALISIKGELFNLSISKKVFLHVINLLLPNNTKLKHSESFFILEEEFGLFNSSSSS